MTAASRPFRDTVWFQPLRARPADATWAVGVAGAVTAAAFGLILDSILGLGAALASGIGIVYFAVVVTAFTAMQRAYVD